MGRLRTYRLFTRDWHKPIQKQGCSGRFNQCWISPLPWSPSEQVINILDAYLQRCYVKSSDKKRCISCISSLLLSPARGRSAFCLASRGSFLWHQLGISFFALHVGTIAKKRCSNSQQWQTVACLELFPYVTLIYHLRLTFEIIFPALNVELKLEIDSDYYLQISKFQKPVHCLAVRSNCDRLHLPVLRAFFCRTAFFFGSPVSLLFWSVPILLDLQSSSLLHRSKVTKVLRMIVFCVRGVPWD